MIQIIVFVPEGHEEKVKTAMFQAGAGKTGNYDSCCFEQSGTGQFRPLKGSQAFIGKLDELEKVKETRIEMMCNDNVFAEVVCALKIAHPYETPAYYGIKTLG